MRPPHRSLHEPGGHSDTRSSPGPVDRRAVLRMGATLAAASTVPVAGCTGADTPDHACEKHVTRREEHVPWVEGGLFADDDRDTPTVVLLADRERFESLADPAVLPAEAATFARETDFDAQSLVSVGNWITVGDEPVLRECGQSERVVSLTVEEETEPGEFPEADYPHTILVRVSHDGDAPTRAKLTYGDHEREAIA